MTALASWRLVVSRAAWLLVALGLGSCSHLRARDETVAEHRHDAALHAERGREERSQYDPSATVRGAPRGRGVAPFAGVEAGRGAFNLTHDHLREADREFRAEKEHLAAARSLLSFEHRACEGLSKGERSSCPLFASRVSLIELTQTGFRIVFQTQVDVDQTWRRLNCHLAHAVARGFDQPSCSLFVKGTTLARFGERGIAFNGDTEAVAELLRAQARRLFLGLVATSGAEVHSPAFDGGALEPIGCVNGARSAPAARMHRVGDPASRNDGVRSRGRSARGRNCSHAHLARTLLERSFEVSAGMASKLSATSSTRASSPCLMPYPRRSST
jgi:hypothetical protein